MPPKISRAAAPRTGRGPADGKSFRASYFDDDTDASRWRRSLRPAPTMTALALLTIAIAVAISGCGARNIDPVRAPMTVVVRTTSTASATHADVAAPKHRPTAPADPVVQAHGRRDRQASGRRALGAGRSRARARHDRDPYRVRLADCGPDRQTQRQVARGDQQLAGNGKVGWIPASATSLTDVGWRIYVSARPPADHGPLRQRGRQADPDLDRRSRRDDPDRPLRGHRPAEHGR